MILKLNAEYGSRAAGFRIQYNVTSKVNSSTVESLPVVDCGETFFTNSSGLILLPRKPNVPLARLNCTYTISSAISTTIVINVTSLDILTLNDSIKTQDDDWPQVDCEADLSDRSIDAVRSYVLSAYSFFMQSSYSYQSIFFCHTLKMFFYSENYDPRETYVIPYRIDTSVLHPSLENDNSCDDVTSTASSGVITSPKFPLPYPHGLNCTYYISGGENSTVSLSFLWFELEDRNLVGFCMYDYLTVECLTNGTSIETPFRNRKFCGDIKWSSAMKLTGCTYVVLKFFADSTVARGGFKILYNVTASDEALSAGERLPTEIPCGDTLFTDFTGVITIPRNPTSYLSRINCTYTIFANQSSTILLNTSSIDLWQISSSFQNCFYDSITIVCVGDHRIFSLCGSQGPFSLLNYHFLQIQTFRSCSILKVSVRSSVYDLQETLQIPFTIVVEEEKCGYTSFSGDVGVVVSPGFPNPYPNNLRCTYTIDIGPRKTILLEFQEFDLETYYFPGVCGNDWLLIRCLPNETTSNPNSYTNRRLCGRSSRPTFALHSCHVVTIQFVTDTSIAKKGFRISYKTCDSANCHFDVSKFGGVCGSTFFTNSTGIITSPNYPEPYLPHLNCTYTIEVAENKSVILDFLYFDVESKGLISSPGIAVAASCPHDWLLIECLSNGSSVSGLYTNRRFCGRSVWQIGLDGCDTVMITFATDQSIAKGGFEIFYMTASSSSSKCDNTSFSATSGIITSPNFPEPYSNNLNCIYSIEVDQNETVSLEFLSFDIEGGAISIPTVAGKIVITPATCEHDWLTIYCLPERSSQVNLYENTKLCGSKAVPFTWTFSGCTSLTLVFVTDKDVVKKGFQIQYRMISSVRPTEVRSSIAVTSASQPSETSVAYNSQSSQPPITHSTTLSTSSECKTKCLNDSNQSKWCNCPVTQPFNLPNSDTNERRSFRASPWFVFLVSLAVVLIVVGALGLAIVKVRRRIEKHERLLENEERNPENTDSEDVVGRQSSTFQGCDTNVRYVPLKSIKSEERDPFSNDNDDLLFNMNAPEGL